MSASLSFISKSSQALLVPKGIATISPISEKSLVLTTEALAQSVAPGSNSNYG
jgi:hypothetical protein